MERRSDRNSCDQEVKELLDALQLLKQELREEICLLSGGDATAGAARSVSDCNRQLKNVEQVIKNIREENPGFCLSCGAAIPMMRLQADPECRQCAICEGKAKEG